MTYLDRLKCFWLFTDVEPLSAGQKVLYLSLLDINNGCFWVEWFTVANPVLQFKTSLSKKGLDEARNKLVQVGLIKYQKGYGNQAGKYKLLEFDSSILPTKDTQTTHRPHTEDAKSGTHTTPLIDKDIDIDKDKDSIGAKPQRPRFIKPSVEEIQAYCTERNNGIDAQHFFDYYEARGWELSKGRKIKDWKACVRTWERSGFNSKPTSPVEEQGGMGEWIG